jgi:hypothetical protein
MEMMCKLSSIIDFSSIETIIISHLVFSISIEKTLQGSQQLVDDFAELPAKIETVEQLEFGKGFKATPKLFDFGLSAKFQNPEEHNTFSVHPEDMPDP